jgi:hypothetical protein
MEGKIVALFAKNITGIFSNEERVVLKSPKDREMN